MNANLSACASQEVSELGHTELTTTTSQRSTRVEALSMNDSADGSDFGGGGGALGWTAARFAFLTDCRRTDLVNGYRANGKIDGFVRRNCDKPVGWFPYGEFEFHNAPRSQGRDKRRLPRLSAFQDQP